MHEFWSVKWDYRDARRFENFLLLISRIYNDGSERKVEQDRTP